MSAEDYEVEQDLYLRGLSKAKEEELLQAVNCLSKRVSRQRYTLLIILVASILGLLGTSYVVFMLYGQ